VVKILVADDNSNIQKMVGLALKDQGIDVVAVGNGEAAVRKISDIRPDLVLADVFMPVRNGYEVCQYVKSDPSLAHIPVILLVGAFDPLDEQEAQRVGADGVLKKPFVPPDPLISMVKSALQRAGVAHGNASAAKAQEPEVLKGSGLLGPSGATVPTLAGIPVQSGPPEPAIADFQQESFVDEVLARPEPVRIDSGSQTVAFGSLLETPADEKDDDLGFLPPVHPELATERDWRDPDLEETDEETEEEKPAAPWRPEASGSYADAGSTSGAKDWRSGSFERILARKTKGESWEPADEKPELVEAAPAASNLVTETPAVPASIPETTALTGAISTTPFAADAWAAAIAANKRDLELVGDVPLIASLLDRALQLDEAYEKGALHEFAITFDPARPEGTTLQKQRQHFERARQLAKGEMISYLVTYAQAVSGPAQNKREYQALLKEAASFDIDQPKARKHRLENVLAQRRATWLLAHEDDVFLD